MIFQRNHIKLSKLLFILFLFIVISEESYAQYMQKILYHGLEGEELYHRVAQDYTPSIQSSYRKARELLYGQIDNHDDTVECIYSGFKQYIDPNKNPVDYAFENGVNTEHIYPQSKGAGDGQARYDLHHLRPSLEYINSRRAANIFSEIQDSETEYWYWLKKTNTFTPTSFIDEYSEATFFKFEPRESIKGDIARSVFYFYTIYRSEAEREDANFFPQMRKILCIWHNEDPVDQSEFERSQQIGEHQDNLANPFVLDCTLATRLYCDDIAGSCNISSSSEYISRHAKVLIYQAIENRTPSLLLISTLPGVWKVAVHNTQGLKLHTFSQSISGTENTMTFDHLGFQPGVYFLNISLHTIDGQVHTFKGEKMLVF